MTPDSLLIASLSLLQSLCSRRIHDVAYKEQANLEKLAEQGSEITGLATGFTDFDKLTAGLQPNQSVASSFSRSCNQLQIIY